jgi:hypothetical protein
MHHIKKESLKDLLDNVNFYKNLLEEKKSTPENLMRYYLSNWKLYYKKSQITKLEKQKLDFQKKSKEYFRKYLDLFPDETNKIFNGTLNHKV